MSSEMLVSSIITIRSQDKGMMDYWFDETKTTNRRVSTVVNLPKYTAGELPISYRVLSHWADLGILPERSKTEAGWRKFTYVERVWVAVADQLRSFGYPLKKISRVREHLLRYNKTLNAYVFFEYYVARALASTEDAYVMVQSDGVADVGTLDEMEINSVIASPKHLLLISLKEVLVGLGEKVVRADIPFVKESPKKRGSVRRNAEP